MSPLAVVVLLPLIVGTALCFALGRDATAAGRRLSAWSAAGVTLLSLGILLSLAPEVFAGRTVLTRAEWAPAIGLSAGFRLDGLALMFGGLITGMGLLIVIYAAHYLGADDSPGKFYSLLMLFMAAMLGVVLSDNLLLLLAFWELTSLSSFLLIGYWGHKEASRSGARMALAVTGGGGLVMLAGFVMLGQIGGSFELSELLTRGDLIRAHPAYPLMLGLILVGCFTKSAQLPFHFWLPAAMAAPTPVSAYLHSATMVKAGLFLLMRLYPVLGGSGWFEGIVAPVGLVTMVFAAAMALVKHDLKALLAYSTVSHLGLITFLIGLGSPLSAVTAVFHVLNHAAFKAALFMIAGIVEHETGTRDMRQLGAVMRALPMTGALALVAAAAMAGVPPLNGFISKEMMLEQALHTELGGYDSWIVPGLATAGALLSVAYSLRFVHDTFFNAPARAWPVAYPHEPAAGMRAPVFVLSLVCVAMGLVPMALAGPLVDIASASMLGHAPPSFELALWHGPSLAVTLSAIALFGGAVLYALVMYRQRLHRHEWRGVDAARAFAALIDGAFALAGRVSSALESRSLQGYLFVMLLAAALAGAWPFIGGPVMTAGDRPQIEASPLAMVVWVLLLPIGAALVLLQRQRFVATVLAGAVGLIASVTFVGLSAPDLAMTQLAIDVVATALLLMGLAMLPQHSPRESTNARRWRDAAVAVAGGGGLGWLTWLVLTRDNESVSWFHLAQSVPAGGGTNAVNVILVDFRGYDTFGEITVLVIGAVGVLALLDGLRAQRMPADDQGVLWSFSRETLLLRTVATLVLPVALVVAVYVFWRGHNLPGGGFIAGVIVATVLVLQYMALGRARAEAVLRAQAGRRFTLWMAAGLCVAGLTGVGAFAFGRPFLTSAHGHSALPAMGEVALATAALFDLGVFLVVVAATMLTLSALAGASYGRAMALRDAVKEADA
jgi:multicomponent K+:H+ antiporter subunit A